MVRFIKDDRKIELSSQVTLEVIAAGLPRTATSSMQAALEHLGYAPCFHMAHVLPHTDRLQLFLNAIREQDREKRQKMVAKLVAGYRGLCDYPVAFFIPDLMDMYPDAKIVLNQRENGEVWAKSAWDSFEWVFSWKFWLSGMLLRNDRLWYALNKETIKYYKETYGRNVFSAASYDIHYNMVRQEAAKRGKPVLEFQPQQGWGPLCEFLQKPVPNEPFPHLNDKATFVAVVRIIILRGVIAWTALAMAVGTGVWATWKFGPTAISQVKMMLNQG